MLGYKYIMINDEKIPNPVSFADGYSKIYNEFTTEGGKSQRSIVRQEKWNAKMTFNLSSYWKDKLKAYSKEDYVMLQFDGAIRKVTLDDYNETLVENSEFCRKTNGYWVVTLTAMEL